MAERQVNFPAIVASKVDSVQKLAKESYELIFKFAVIVLSDYFNYTHPVLIGAVNRIAADLIETRPTWQSADFINLCKFFRQRQDIEELKVYGQITPEKFMSMVSVYEFHRAQAMEDFKNKEKNKGMMFSEVDESNKDKANEFMKNLTKKLEAKKVTLKIESPPDEKYFNELAISFKK